MSNEKMSNPDINQRSKKDIAKDALIIILQERDEMEKRIEAEEVLPRLLRLKRDQERDQEGGEKTEKQLDWDVVSSQLRVFDAERLVRERDKRNAEFAHRCWEQMQALQPDEINDLLMSDLFKNYAIVDNIINIEIANHFNSLTVEAASLQLEDDLKALKESLTPDEERRLAKLNKLLDDYLRLFGDTWEMKEDHEEFLRALDWRP